jgi:ribosomal protein L21E
MQRFSEGDRVRIDIPDETDPDHQEYHGEHGQVVAVLSDDADSVTADERDAQLYRVAFDSGETADFRWRDLRPPIDDSSQA